MVCLLLSVIVVISIINNRSNPAYKLAWIIPILIFPIFGGAFYLMFGYNKTWKRKNEKIKEAYIDAISDNNDNVEKIKQNNIIVANQANYIHKYAHAPVYENTQTEYLPLGEVMFERLKEELQQAKRFIFMEYFIIGKGIMWDSILDILVSKAKEGVDVRLIYDDMGSLLNLPYGYHKKLEKLGVKCCVFNPITPLFSFQLNNRDHRKICVIDGHTAFTGGINLADEYINAYERFGHWKDTGIVLHGEAAWSFTLMFLSLWDKLKNIMEDYNMYRPLPEIVKSFTSDGFVQPYSDSPIDHESVGESVYMNMINTAKHYIYITTPYLVIDNAMTDALNLAAKRGVDVRIMTPHIPDKWYVHAVTRANYELLVECGVKIFEYTPGFIHSKTFVVDDELAVVGTINMDFRSLYLHYECAVWLYKTKSVMEVKEDFIQSLESCEEITLNMCKSISWSRRLTQSLLRVFSPLL